MILSEGANQGHGELIVAKQSHAYPLPLSLLAFLASSGYLFLHMGTAFGTTFAALLVASAVLDQFRVDIQLSKVKLLGSIAVHLGLLGVLGYSLERVEMDTIVAGVGCYLSAIGMSLSGHQRAARKASERSKKE